MSFFDEYSPINKILFPSPNPPGYHVNSWPSELAWIGEARSPCLVMPYKGARTLLIYLHGNAEDIGHSRSMLEALRYALQCHIVAVEYPGYGLYPGRPCEASVNAAVERIHSYIIDVLKFASNEIIVFGRSIGTGPATKLVARTGAKALILMSPYTSIRGVVKHLLGSGAPYLISDRFRNEKEIRDVWCPVLILHGKLDTLIPYTHAERLHTLCPSQIKSLHISETMDHNLFDLDSDIVTPIQMFLCELDEMVNTMSPPNPFARRAPPRPLRLDPSAFVPPPSATPASTPGSPNLTDSDRAPARSQSPRMGPSTFSLRRGVSLAEPAQRAHSPFPATPPTVSLMTPRAIDDDTPPSPRLHRASSLPSISQSSRPHTSSPAPSPSSPLSFASRLLEVSGMLASRTASLSRSPVSRQRTDPELT